MALKWPKIVMALLWPKIFMALKWPKMSIQTGLCMIQDSNILNQDKGKNKKTKTL